MTINYKAFYFKTSQSAKINLILQEIKNWPKNQYMPVLLFFLGLVPAMITFSISNKLLILSALLKYRNHHSLKVTDACFCLGLLL